MEDDNLLFNKALENFASDNFQTALKIFKDLSVKYPDKSIYSLYSGICELKIKEYSKSIDDLEKAEKGLKNSFLLNFTKGIVLFKQKKFVESKVTFSTALRYASSPEEMNKITPWLNKALIEMESIGVIEYNSQIAGDIKIISNWIQTKTDLIVELTANKNLNGYTVQLESKRILIVTDDSKREIKCGINLSNAIVPEKSVFKISGMKIELKLSKLVPDFEWVMLEDNKCPSINNPNDKSASGYYPSSSKVKKNWGVLEQEMEDQDWKERTLFNGGDEGMMRLFRYIYSTADENTRKAMIKSYSTSGGTVLSTNWEDVKNKDYEGKDKPEAPAGREWGKNDK